MRMLMDIPLSDGYKVRGLFIENSPIFRQWIAELLSSKIELVEADSFDEGLKILESSVHVDFILVDWEMLDTHGLGALQEIRKRNRKPIILLAGREFSQDEFRHVMDSGVVECLRKEEVEKRYTVLDESQPTLKLMTEPPLAATVIDAVTANVSKDVEECLRDFDQALLKLKE